MADYEIVAGSWYVVQYAIARTLARESDGRLWAGYVRSDGTYNQIYVSYSDDNGENWTEIQVTDAGYHQFRVSIAIDSSDTLHIVWDGRDWGTNTTKPNVEYAKKTSAGVWSPDGPPYARGSTEPTHVTDESDNQNGPNLAIDGDDTLHIVWSGKGWGTNTGVYNQQYAKVTSGGNWTPDGPPYASGGTQPEHITDSASAQDRVSVAVDSSGYVHVAWHGKGWGVNTTIFNIQYRLRTDSWQAQEGITDDDDVQRYPSIALDSNDIPHVAWDGRGYGANTAIYQIVYSNRIGGAWAAPANLTDEAAIQEHSSLGLDGSDKRYVVFYGKGHGVNTTKYNIQLLRYESAAWQAMEHLTDLAYDNKEPSLLWASHPTIDGLQTNVPTDGCCFRWHYEDGDGKAERYYCSDDLVWAEAAEGHIGLGIVGMAEVMGF